MISSRLVWVVEALLLASSAVAFGQESESASTADIQGILNEAVVSTASKSAEMASVSPATSVSIAADDLRALGIRSIDEAINYLGLGMVTENPLHSVEVGARGVLFTADFGNHVLMLVNGHAMNEQWDGTAYFERGAAIPFELIDHIEIILGPGSVLYGSNAMLGVINIVTKRAKDFQGLHLMAEADGLHLFTGELVSGERVAVGYGSSFELFGQTAELTGQLEYYRQVGPSFSFGPQLWGNDEVTGEPKQFAADGSNPGTWGGKADRSYYTHIPAAYARLAAGDFELNARLASYKRATPYVNEFNQLLADFNNPESHELDQWLDLDLKHHANLGSIAALSWRAYADLYRYAQTLHISAAEDCSVAELPACRQVADGRSRWAGLDLQLTFDWLGDSRLVTLLGADGRIRDVSMRYDILDLENGEVQDTFGAHELTEVAAGIYLQQTARLWHALDLSAGIRFDGDQRFGTHLSPRGAAVARLWEGGSLKAIYSEAFRAPTTYEVYYEAPDSQIPAPHLKPEVVRSAEGVIEQRLGAQRLLLGGFYAWWSDMVLMGTASEDNPVLADARARGLIGPDITEVSQYRNVASLINYGLNAAVSGSLLNGTLRYGLTLTLAKARRDEVPLPVAPSAFGNAHLTYALPGKWPQLGLACFYQGRRPADRAFDGDFVPVPYAPGELEIRGSLTGPVPSIEGLTFSLSADYSTASVGPYVVGPIQAATDDQPSAELVPVDRFRVRLGFRLDL